MGKSVNGSRVQQLPITIQHFVTTVAIGSLERRSNFYRAMLRALGARYIAMANIVCPSLRLPASAPSHGVYHFFVLDSVCHSVTMFVCYAPLKLLLFCFSMESSHFLAISSPCGTLQNCCLRFLRATACYSAYMHATPMPTVPPSVYLSHACIVSKRLNVSSKFFHSDRPIILVFGHHGSLRKSDGFTPNGGSKYKGGSNF